MSSKDSNIQEKSTDKQQPGPNLQHPEVHALLDRYWRRNLLLTVILLMVWAVAGLGCGVLLADRLNRYNLPGTGFPLGFWFAHQGSIIVFVLLILIYCLFMNKFDARHHKELEQLKKNRGR